MGLTNYITERLQQKKICLMTHVIAGYPSFSDNLAMIELMDKHGIDLLEIQMPFSEPSADGPLFAMANQAALLQGVKVKDYFSFMKTVTERFAIPVLMMGYYNPIFQMGDQEFLNRLEDSGGTGFIIPDLPLEEGLPLYTMAKDRNIAPITFMTPFASPERLQKQGKDGAGFIYVVSRSGVTGEKTAFAAQATTDYLTHCRNATQLPLAVGFGINEPDQVEYLIGKAQVAIIGTAILKTWQQGGAKALGEFLGQMT